MFSERLKPIDERLLNALAWLEGEKRRQMPRERYDALNRVYWLLRDMRQVIEDRDYERFDLGRSEAARDSKSVAVGGASDDPRGL